MHPDSDAFAFIRSMFDSLHDDGPRCVFADWLAENPHEIVETVRYFVEVIRLNGYRLQFNLPASSTCKVPPPLPSQRWPAGVPRPARG